MARWDEFDEDEVDASGSDEVTKQTEEAHRWAFDRATTQWGEDGYEYAEGRARLRILTPYGYVVEVRGQSAGGGHGKQGAHPARIAELRALPEPVMVIFVDGNVVEGTASAQWMWLDDPVVPIANIDMDPAHRRMGWFVRDMNRTPVTAFVFPTEVPHFESAGLF